MTSKRYGKKNQVIKDDYYSTIGQINTDNFQFLSEFVSNFISRSNYSVKKSFLDHLKKLNCSKKKIDKFSAYLATSYSIRDRLVQFFNVTMNYYISSGAKQLYFVSSEFLMGRFLRNALLNLKLEKVYKEILHHFNLKIDDVYEEEYDPGPGSNENGRFAACLLDSLATLNYPAWGYGILYSNGYFQQEFGPDGKQIEKPDYFIKYIEPWRIKRPLITYEVGFGGNYNENDHEWRPQEKVQAVANDFLIPGFHTINTIALRLWSSDCDNQNQGNSNELSQLTDSIYPSDSDDERVVLMRFKQEYFLSSATVQDILHRLRNEQHGSIQDLPQFASIHLNNTQPCLMTIELLRILIDVEGMSFEDAFIIVNQVFSFTCQSLIPMTFERFPVYLFERYLPRHLSLIYELNQRVLDDHQDNKIKSEISFIEEGSVKKVRMSNLAIICSHKVIGVSETQIEMLTNTIFNCFSQHYRDKFLHITNGISIRRWLHHCNKPLSELITQSLGGDEFWPIFNTAQKRSIVNFKIANAKIKSKNKNKNDNSNCYNNNNNNNDDDNDNYSNSNYNSNNNNSNYSNNNDNSNYSNNNNNSNYSNNNDNNNYSNNNDNNNYSNNNNNNNYSNNNSNSNYSNNYSSNNNNNNSDDDDDYSSNCSSKNVGCSGSIKLSNGYKIDPSIQPDDWSSTAEVLRNLIEDETFHKEFSHIKYKNKVKLSNFIKSVCNVELDPDLQLFDIHSKEFKHHHRQALHVFSIIYIYLILRSKNENELNGIQPHAFIISGKASPSSTFLLSLVHLINNVANVINKDEKLGSLIRIAFIPNYNVTVAEKLVAGADLNVQISTPGMEAASTSNMKFSINGSVIIGTNDGTNREIGKKTDNKNVIFMGLPLEVLDLARQEAGNPIIDEKLRLVFDAIRRGEFGDPQNYEEVLRSVEQEDYFLVNAEFEEYLNVQSKIDNDYFGQNFGDGEENGIKFSERRVASIPVMGEFSSDKEAVEYAEKVWDIKQFPLPIKCETDDDDNYDDNEEEEEEEEEENDDDDDDEI